MKQLICLVLCCLLGMTLAAACGETLTDMEKPGPAVTLHDGWDTRDQNRVFYEIFVGSFSDSDGDGIGDLRGIINRMDYLNDGDPASGKSLGVEGLWLTPVFTSPSYHKYDVTDFYQIDPVFGSESDLRELLEICHDRDVLVILDLPINHTGTACRWFKNFTNAHLMHNPNNDYYDFYTWCTEADTRPAGRHFTKVSGQDLLYESNFSDGMPELNFDNEKVRQAVLDVARYWLEAGVDGFRFDAAKYLYLGDNPSSVAFWTWYLNELKAIRPDIYTVAEVWDGDGVTDQYQPVMNCFHFTTSQTEGLIAATAKGSSAGAFATYTQKRIEHLKSLNPEAMNIYFISNHDMDRAAGYLTVASGQMKVAASLYLLCPGSPFIYYGEEIGLRGSRGGANTDANRRLAMFWGDGDTVHDPAGSDYAKQTPYSVKDLYGFDSSLYYHYRKVLQLRKANPEIARGDCTALSVPDTKAGGFLCEWNGSAALVLHNPGPSDVTVDLAALTGREWSELSGFAGEGIATLENQTLTLEGQTSAVIR